MPVPVDRDETGEPVVPSWERIWLVFDRWGGLLLLGLSTVMAALNPDRTAGDRGFTLVIAAAAAVWIVRMHVMAPDGRLQRSWYAAAYVAGVIGFAALLMSRDVVFWIFAITGFLHSSILRPRALVFVGVGVTSFAINVTTWGGVPSGDTEAMVSFVALVVIQTLLIGSGMVGGDRLMELSEERRETVRRLEATLAENEGLHAQLVAQAREAGIHDERQRLARDIHDTLAQGFAGIITQLEAANQATDADALRRHLATASNLARRSLDEARRSVHALGPGALHPGRLTDALHVLARDWTEVYGVDVQVTVEGTAEQLPADLEGALLGVAQEALNNTAKHADAGRVAVTLAVLDDQVLLDVRDDGRGFPADRSTAEVTANGSGYGLATMRSRVAGVGGSLTVESEPDVGTAISAQVPREGDRG
jgi:signal transduction histidine kinase